MKPARDVGVDEHLGAVHRLVAARGRATGSGRGGRRRARPGRAGSPTRSARPCTSVGEVGGAQAGVAAVLVDLVGGRLDQQQAAVGVGLAGGGLDDQRVRGADGGDPDGLAGAVARDEVAQRVGGSGGLGHATTLGPRDDAASQSIAIPVAYRYARHCCARSSCPAGRSTPTPCRSTSRSPPGCGTTCVRVAPVPATGCPPSGR